MQRLVIIAFLLSFFVSTSHSQTVGGVEVVKPQIKIGKWDSVSKKMFVAIEFTMAPKWHLYWLNPGDAGSPPEVTWELPEGWVAGGLDFPVPKKLEEEGIVSYVYYDKLTLTAEIRAPENPIGKSITANLKWMVCKDICIPGSKQLKAKVGKEPANVTPQFVSRLVQARIESWTMRDVSSQDHKTFQLRLSRGDSTVPVEDFFPNIVKNALVDFKVKDGALVYTVRPIDRAESVGQINGLVTVEGKTYWLR